MRLGVVLGEIRHLTGSSWALQVLSQVGPTCGPRATCSPGRLWVLPDTKL